MATISGFRRWALALAIAWAGSTAHGDVIDWTGGGAPNQNWSTAANWAGTNTPPLPADIARFLNAGAAGAAGTVTNIADAPFGGAIGGIEFQNTTGSFHTTNLAGGTLQVDGDLVVNRNLLTNVVAWFTNGVLSVGSAPSRTDLFVGRSTTDHATNVVGTLNLSGLSQFNAYLNALSVGHRTVGGSNTGAPQGTLVLAANNTIDALNITVSDNRGPTTIAPTSTLTFGSGTNSVMTDTFLVGGVRATGVVNMASGGILNLSGSSGAAADLLVGYNPTNTLYASSGSFNVAAGAFNAVLNDLILGYHASKVITSPAGGSTTGTLTLGVNTNVTANRVVLGDAGTHPVDGAGSGTGTINMAGGTFNVTGDVTLGTGTSTSAGTISMTGGTMNIGGNLLDGAGTGRLNLLNGTVNVAGDMTLDSPAASPIQVGAVNSTGATAGTGVLDVNGAFAQIGLPTRRADFYIGRRTAASSVVARGTADFSDVDTFTGYFTNLFLGTVTVTGTPEAAAYGTLLLAASYNLVNATTITVADSENVGMGGDVSRLRLSGVNDFIVTSLNIGGRKARGELDFYAPGGVLNLSGPGGGRTNIILGNQTTATAGGSTGTMNLAGSTFNALIGSWVIGSKVNTATGTTAGTVTMSDGYVDATSIILARRADAGTAGIVRGTFNLQGGNLVVGSISGSPTNANTTSDTVALNFSNGILTAGSITKGAATTLPFAFNWTGGTLRVGTFGASGTNLSINLLNTGTGILDPGTIGDPTSTTTIWGNYVQGPNATLRIDLGGYVQGVDYDFVTASGTATIDGVLHVAGVAGFNPNPYDTFDVFRASSISLGSSFTVLSDYGGYFLHQIIPGQGYQVLQLTYVPEPGTLALLGLGLAALARRRRRTAARGRGRACLPLLAALLLCLAAAREASAAVITWDAGGGANMNWSNGLNWTGDIPPGTADEAVFNDLTGAGVGVVTNIVDSTRTISILNYTMRSGAEVSFNHATQITAGATLLATTRFDAGPDDFNMGGHRTINVTLTGGDAASRLQIGNTGTNTATVRIARNPDDPSGRILTVNLDMSGLANFVANVNTFDFANGVREAGGVVSLAENSTIDANSLTVGRSTGNNTATPTLRLGRTNTLDITTITIGGQKTHALLNFNTDVFSDPNLNSVTIRGVAGGTSRVADFRIGYNDADTASTPTCIVDFTGGTVDARVTNLLIGYKASGNTGDAFGFLRMAAGTFDATSIILGQTVTGTTSANQAEGTLELYGGQFTAGTITLGSQAGSGLAKGTILLNGSTLTANTIQRGGGTGVFTWNSGTLRVGSFGAAGSPMNLSNTGTGILDPGVGSATGTTNIFGNYVQGSNATLRIDLGGYAQGTQYDFVTATGTATIDGALYVAQAAGFLPNPYDIFDVFRASSITLGSSFTVLSDYGGYFLHRIIPDQGFQVLQLTYVPEPGTLALLGLGLLAIARRRRK